MRNNGPGFRRGRFVLIWSVYLQIAFDLQSLADVRFAPESTK